MSLKQWCPFVLACTLSISGMASATELSVKGKIRPDGACSMTLGNGGVLDLGSLSSKDYTTNRLRDSDVQLTINCQRSTKVALKAIDNRKGTTRPGSYGSFGLNNPAIGDYDIRPENTVYPDGAGEPAYTTGLGGSDGFLPPDRLLWWGRDTSPDPWAPRETVAFKTLKTSLRIYVNLRKDIAVNDVLEIDGSATLELVYL